VAPENSKQSVTGRHAQFVIEKKEVEEYWPRLTKGTGKVLISLPSLFSSSSGSDSLEHTPFCPNSLIFFFSLSLFLFQLNFLKTDFSRWKDEDEVDEEEESGAGAGGMPGGFDMSQFVRRTVIFCVECKSTH